MAVLPLIGISDILERIPSQWRNAALSLENQRVVHTTRCSLCGSVDGFFTESLGPHAIASEQRDDTVQQSNCPTQAKTGLEWATRRLSPHFQNARRAGTLRS